MKITLLILLIFITNAFSQSQIAFSALSSGGEKQANSIYVIVGTLGQLGSGKCENAINQAQAGFWSMYSQNVLQDIKDENILPIEYRLEQNFPNPFNPSTVIKFGLPERVNVEIKIYDILGSEVNTLINQEMEASWYNLEFDAAGYSTGIYICRMQAGNYINTKKMLLIK